MRRVTQQPMIITCAAVSVHLRSASAISDSMIALVMDDLVAFLGLPMTRIGLTISCRDYQLKTSEHPLCSLGKKKCLHLPDASLVYHKWGEHLPPETGHDSDATAWVSTQEWAEQSGIHREPPRSEVSETD